VAQLDSEVEEMQNEIFSLKHHLKNTEVKALLRQELKKDKSLDHSSHSQTTH